MKKTLLSSFRYVALLVTLTLNMSAKGIPSQDYVRLPGHVLDRPVAKSRFVDKVNPEKNISLSFVLPLRNQEELEALIHKIHNPEDTEYYGKYLSSEEFTERFSPTVESYKAVKAYAKELGFKIKRSHSNRLLLNVKGSAEAIEKGFNLSLNRYQQKNGRMYFAPTENPAVPITMAKEIQGVIGLDNCGIWKNYNLKKSASETILYPNSAQQYPSGPNGGFGPNDIAIAYNLSEVIPTGTGQNVALFQLASYQQSDINAYTTYFGLPQANITNVLVDGGSGVGINPEVTLDIELVLSIAPNSHIYVYEGPNSNQGVLDTYNRIATDNIAKQVSTSWGLGENLVSTQYLQAENTIFMQMAAQGQTIYAAAGDSGAYDDYDTNHSTALVVDDPACQPYVSGVGGTTLTVNRETGSYTSEIVWNHGLGNGAGGGGVSKVWPIPSWQTNVTTTFSKTNRNVPDVALNADPNTGYAIYYDGQWTIFGGTSCAAPLWAGFTARVNQQRQINQLTTLGFANPIFYSLGKTSEAIDFHDTTTGNNLYYSAGAGYDNATGWGSFNGLFLFQALTGSTVTPPTPSPTVQKPVLTVSMTHSGNFTKGSTGTYQIKVTNTGNAATSGNVEVVIGLPSGLTFKSFSGSGWTFSGNNTFTQNSVLNPGGSYPILAVNVNVSRFTASVVTPTATVSGGGSVTSTTSNPTSTKK